MGKEQTIISAGCWVYMVMLHPNSICFQNQCHMPQSYTSEWSLTPLVFPIGFAETQFLVQLPSLTTTTKSEVLY